MAVKNFYELLDVEPTAEAHEIKTAYRKLALKYHPDTSTDEGDNELFKLITDAYHTLTDEKERQIYDLRIGLKDNIKEKIDIYEKAKREAEEATRKPEKAAAESPKDKGREEDEDSDAWIKGGSTLDSVGKTFKRFFHSDTSEQEAFGGGKQKKDQSLYSRLRGDREYYFSIDALESIRGTSREIALKAGDSPRVIRIKIPKGVSHGSRLSLPYPAQGKLPAGKLKILVHITPHEFVERDGLDIVIKVPLTIAESISGTNLTIPTLEGSTKVKIPPQGNFNKRLRLKGRGVKTNSGVGDLYVAPIVVVPPGDSDVLVHAANAMEAFYDRDVRAQLPKKL